MRVGPSDVALGGAVSWSPSASSVLAGQFLADDIPIIGGRVSCDTTQLIQGQVSFQVPDFDRGMSWIPLEADHPLAKFGQQIDLQIDTGTPVTGDVFHSRMGRFQIQDWQHDDIAGIVEVTCMDLLKVADDAKLTTPVVPRVGETFTQVFTRLVPDGIGVTFDPALIDRPVPQSFQWQSDRLGALYDIVDAWPARLRVDAYGTYQVLAPLPDVAQPIMQLTDGQNGTLIGAPSEDTRDQVYNAVLVTGADTDDPARAAVSALAIVSGGPFDPSTYNLSVKPYSSPLLTTQAQCLATAQNLLKESLRPALSRLATIAPDPRIDVDDTIELLQDPYGLQGSTLAIGWAVAYDIPLVVGDNMTVTVGAQVWS